MEERRTAAFSLNNNECSSWKPHSSLSRILLFRITHILPDKMGCLRNSRVACCWNHVFLCDRSFSWCFADAPALFVSSDQVVSSLWLVYLQVSSSSILFRGHIPLLSTAPQLERRKIRVGAALEYFIEVLAAKLPVPSHRPHIKTIFQGIAAKVGTGEPCCDWASAGPLSKPDGNMGVDITKCTGPPWSQRVALGHKLLCLLSATTAGA